MQPRTVVAVGVALLIDGLQAILALAFLGVGTVISGATLGIATPVAVPTAAIFSFASDTAISLTLGAGFILMLKYFDMYYPMQVFGFGLAEVIPGFDLLPAWTAMAVWCALRKNAEDRLVAEGERALLVSKTRVPDRSGSTPSAVEQAQQSLPLPANDNKDLEESIETRSSSVPNMDGIVRRTRYTKPLTTSNNSNDLRQLSNAA